MPRTKPKPQARGLAEGLRFERRACKLAMVEVAEKLGWSESTLSRIETGLRNASAEEVSALLAIYQVTGARRDTLIEMARDVDRPVWVELRYAEVPEQAKTLAQYEADATKIVGAAVTLIPGLLQTPSYIRSLMNAGGVAPQDIPLRVDVRLKRQKVLSGKSAPTLVSFVDEAALHRRIGGARVMADQLKHLLAMAEHPSIDLRVVPFDVGGHAAVNGPFVLLEFADRKPIVHLEQLRSGLFLDQAVDVDPYIRAIASLDAVSLDPLQSVRMIEHLAATYE
jgi:transcriptional regulator with XRE-family HTH domain